MSNTFTYLMKGCCLERMKEIPDQAIDAVMADIPFGTTRCKWDTVVDPQLMWEQLLRVTRPESPILLFAQTPFDKVLGVSNIEMLRYEWVWEKTSATGHLNAKKMPMKAHENILVFYKKLPKYYPQKTQGSVLKETRTGKVYNSECYGQEKAKPDYSSTSRYPRSVIKFSSDKQRLNLHVTQKPLELMRYFVRTYTEEGDSVLDFTMGSGTTGVACVEENRSFVGIDLAIAVAKKRIITALKAKTLSSNCEQSLVD